MKKYLTVSAPVFFLVLILSFSFLPLFVEGSDGPDKWVEQVRDWMINIGKAMVIIGFMWAGILYLTCAGDPSKMNQAKTFLVAAIIGTVIIVIAENAADTISNWFGLE